MVFEDRAKDVSFVSGLCVRHPVSASFDPDPALHNPLVS